MRIIFVIAVFTLAMGNVTPISSGVVEASSLQARSLRGEVHEDGFSRELLRLRRPLRPVDGTDTPDNDSTSVEQLADGVQAPPRRERRNPARGEEAPSTENGDGAVSTPNQSNTGTRPRLRRPNGHLNLNRDNTKNTPETRADPRSRMSNKGGIPTTPITGLMLGFPFDMF
jgi:hypothetical protein